MGAPIGCSRAARHSPYTLGASASGRCLCRAISGRIVGPALTATKFPVYPLACRQSVCYILNHMVQYIRTGFDASFAALSDATRRGVLEQLGRADASITDLAERFHMTLTGMKKHVGVLEQAGRPPTPQDRRVADRQTPP